MSQNKLGIFLAYNQCIRYHSLVPITLSQRGAGSRNTQLGRLAQRSEQWTHNPLVTGSNPVPPIKNLLDNFKELDTMKRISQLPALIFPVRKDAGFFLHKKNYGGN